MLWKGIMPYLDFSSHAQTERMLPVVNLGVIVEDAQASYEAINLMARHILLSNPFAPRISRWRASVAGTLLLSLPLNKEAVALASQLCC